MICEYIFILFYYQTLKYKWRNNNNCKYILPLLHALNNDRNCKDRITLNIKTYTTLGHQTQINQTEKYPITNYIYL